MKEPLLVRADFDRPNLFLRFEKSDNIDVNVLDPFIEKYIKEDCEDRIIIYTCSRKDTVDLSEEINKKWKKLSLAYHAGLSKNERYYPK